ncbi:winged helix DNA-binding domain-containing protein [Dyadobacter luticola]|uniref:Winged helix DNA-binding domain-containing protein n=1 Tax=Dyadobacter luticola TaxID=1979387 RepID=A0A5R9KRD0_9BACT|nr:winged helix DNA-binding domain-containing protein [Dyadobacter luticola]TLU98717.1 winged helix DNA-binding domain-containing protein [Dyadobacter luticola]
MTIHDIIHLRLQNQLISDARVKSPEEVVSWLGAMQAQDYTGARWSIGLRLQGIKDSDIDKALASKSIVRTWPMRGTLHFVASEDVHWILKLLTPRIISGMAGRNRQLSLDEKVFAKSEKLLVPALEGGKQLMRSEVFKIWEDHGIKTSDQRGIHIINYLAQKQVICHGLHNEKQATYTLLDEWVTKSRNLEGEEALAELALRYFTSHGPATIQDFIWWTGLKITDAKLALNSISGKLQSSEMVGKIYWYSPELPDRVKSDAVFMLLGFDEYMLGYTDRSLILHRDHSQKIVPGNNGMFMPTIIIGGKVRGTWKRTIKKDAVQIDFSAFEKVSQAKKHSFEVAARKYGKYLGKTVSDINWL